MQHTVPNPRQLFRLFHRGALTREQLHAAMAIHARDIIEEIVEVKRNPMAAYFEQLLNQRAATRLIRDHGEAVVREILVALADAPEFPPSNLLWNAGHWDVPLHCFLRVRREPVFRVSGIEDRRTAVVVSVEHGSNRRKQTTREAFSLRRDWRGQLFVESRRLL